MGRTCTARSACLQCMFRRCILHHLYSFDQLLQSDHIAFDGTVPTCQGPAATVMTSPNTKGLCYAWCNKTSHYRFYRGYDELEDVLFHQAQHEHGTVRNPGQWMRDHRGAVQGLHPTSAEDMNCLCKFGPTDTVYRVYVVLITLRASVALARSSRWFVRLTLLDKTGQVVEQSMMSIGPRE